MAKRRFFRRRKFTKKNLSIAKKALKKVNKLARTLKPEWKSFTTVLPATATNNVGVVDNLILIAEGTDEHQRSGQRVKLVKLNVTMSLEKASAGNATIQIRYIIYVDKRQVVDQKSTPANILETVNVFSGINTNRVQRFRILSDRLITLRTNRIATSFRFSRKLMLPVGFNGALGTDIEKNGLNIMRLSSESSNLPTVEYNIRVYFTDV